jgi:hypothetical protein
MSIVLVKGADRDHAVLKSEFLVKFRVSQNKERAFLDDILAQGKPKQLRPKPLALKLGGHCQGRQVKAADLVSVVRI